MKNKRRRIIRNLIATFSIGAFALISALIVSFFVKEKSETHFLREKGEKESKEKSDHLSRGERMKRYFIDYGSKRKFMYKTSFSFRSVFHFPIPFRMQK